MPKQFTLTEIQKKARVILNSIAIIILLFGGSRSGKTFLIIRNIVLRALKEPNSRHAIFRQTRKDLKESIWMDTFPKVINLCFTGLTFYKNEQDLYVRFNNGSEIWFGYLDDAKRADNVLGKEYNTIYLNEISEISYAMYTKVLTRLSLKNGLINKLYADCNPPGRWHWAYKLWIEKVNPFTKGAVKESIPNPEKYAYLIMNPKDNLENLSADYLEILKSLPEDERNRFLYGIWQEGISGGIYTKEIGIAEQEGRITRVPHDPEFKVYTFWDLGIDDHTSIIFAQFIGNRINIIDFYQNNNEGMLHYTALLKCWAEVKDYEYGTLYLPHDGANREWISGRNRRQALEGEGFIVDVLPASLVVDGINGAKILFPQIWIDSGNCIELLEALRNYRRKFDALKMIDSKEPVHDWASHPADAFRYLGMGYTKRLAETTKPEEEEQGMTFEMLMQQRIRRAKEND